MPFIANFLFSVELRFMIGPFDWSNFKFRRKYRGRRATLTLQGLVLKTPSPLCVCCTYAVSHLAVARGRHEFSVGERAAGTSCGVSSSCAPRCSVPSLCHVPCLFPVNSTFMLLLLNSRSSFYLVSIPSLFCSHSGPIVYPYHICFLPVRYLSTPTSQCMHAQLQMMHFDPQVHGRARGRGAHPRQGQHDQRCLE